MDEVRDIVQETGIKTIPMEKKCKKKKKQPYVILDLTLITDNGLKLMGSSQMS